MNCTARCRKARHIVATMTALFALAACGGAPQAEGQATATQLVSQPVPQAAHAEPADAGARTRPGLYLTPEQAQALAHRLYDRLVRVEASCCGADSAELDVQIAFGVQAAANLPNDAPFVVSGGDLRQAAVVVNRLSELGARQVHLVTR